MSFSAKIMTCKETKKSMTTTQKKKRAAEIVLDEAQMLRLTRQTLNHLFKICSNNYSKLCLKN